VTESEDGPLGRLRSLLAAVIGDPALVAIGAQPVALGWATVELDRASLELGAELGIQPGQFIPAAPTPALGARCRMAQDVVPTGVALVILEPSTEGRLAASLARRGEGPAAVWLAVASLPEAVTTLRRTGVATSVPGIGPLGRECLLHDRPIHGPHRLVVELAGTIPA